MKTTRTAALIAGIALSLSACGGSPAPAAVTVTETQSAAASPTSSARTPDPVTSSTTEDEAPAMSNREIAALAIKINWDKASSEDRGVMCDGYRLAPEPMLDAFMSGVGDDGLITRGDVETFLDDHC